MKKIFAILSIILGSIYFVLRGISFIIPYIQFEDEIFKASEKSNYRGVEMEILDISYNKEYRIEHMGSEDFVMDPANGNEFVFITMEFNNHSDQYFAVADLYWELSVEKKEKEYSSSTANMDGLYPSLEPENSNKYTYVFEIPKESSLKQLAYYKRLDKPSNMKPLNKAADFVILFE